MFIICSKRNLEIKELEEQLKAITLECDEARKELQCKQRDPSTTGGLLKVVHHTKRENKREKSVMSKYIARYEH